MPCNGQRNPSLSPCTAPIGYSDNRLPTGNVNRMSNGATNTTSRAPRMKQRRSACRTSAFNTASP